MAEVETAIRSLDLLRARALVATLRDLERAVFASDPPVPPGSTPRPPR